jgi:hypothetical protein
MRTASDLEHDEHVQDPAARLDAEVVDQGQEGDGRDCQRNRRRIRPAAETQRVAGKRDRDGRDRAAFNQQEQRPAVHEAHERMPPVSQVEILTAGFREDRAELGIGKCTGERDQAPGNPRREHERARVEALGNNVGIDEDAGADDAADDDHRGIEWSQRAAETHAGSLRDFLPPYAEAGTREPRLRAPSTKSSPCVLPLDSAPCLSGVLSMISVPSDINQETQNRTPASTEITRCLVFSGLSSSVPMVLSPHV